MAAASNSCQSSLLGLFYLSMLCQLCSTVRSWTLAGRSERPLPRLVSQSTFDLWTITLSVVCCFPSSCFFFHFSLTCESSVIKAVIHTYFPHFVFTVSLFLLNPLKVTHRANLATKKTKTKKKISSSHFPVCIPEGQTGIEPASLVIGACVCVGRVNWKFFLPFLV